MQEARPSNSKYPDGWRIGASRGPATSHSPRRSSAKVTMVLPCWPSPERSTASCGKTIITAPVSTPLDVAVHNRRCWRYTSGMPELPEVEFARRSLVRWFDGRELVKAEADKKARTFRGASPAEFETIKGSLKKAERRGKYLMLSFSDGHGLVAHLGMTGKFVKRAAGAQEPYSRAKFVLDSGEVIHFRDPRLFGRMEPMRDHELATNSTIVALGHDPLVDGLTGAQLAARVGSSKQDLKVALMDQSRVAGLGNIHAAEALFRAKIHPARKPATLTDAEAGALAKAIHVSIAFALKTEGGNDEIQYVKEGEAENPFFVYDRGGLPCMKCKTLIESFDQGGRTTYFCPGCQPAPKGRATPKAKAKLKPAKKKLFAKGSRR